MPRVCGRKDDTSRRKERWKERGNTRTYRTPFVVRHVVSCRRCKRWDEKGVRGIVGVGKLKAEAPRCRSDQPTPRCFAQKKGKEKKRERERKEESRKSRVAERPRSRESTNARYVFRVLGETAFHGCNPTTEERPDSHKTFKLHNLYVTHIQIHYQFSTAEELSGMCN